MPKANPELTDGRKIAAILLVYSYMKNLIKFFSENIWWIAFFYLILHSQRDRKRVLKK